MNESQNPMHDLDELEAPTIEMNNFSFKPETLRVREGSIIKLVNNDPAEHSLTETEGEFDIEIEGGNQGELIAPGVGTYDFYCKYHPDMVGKLIVEAP